MKQYLDLLQKLIWEGKEAKDRTGTGTYRLFGAQLRFDMRNGLPVITTKKIILRSVIHELLWMLSGSDNIQYLKDNNVHIWDNWADEDGNVGPMYGTQWRQWHGIENGREVFIDQLQQAINLIKSEPYSRRIVVSAWNPADMPNMALAPCHILYQFHPDPTSERLSMSMYQRSADAFLGLPFDITSYALLLSMVAHVTGYKTGDLIISLGDVHLYKNHWDAAVKQTHRTPLKLPTLYLKSDVKNIDDFTVNDIEIENYKHYPRIKAPISV